MSQVGDRHWWYQGLRQVVLDHLREAAPAGTELRVLDAGCGTGTVLQALAEGGQAVGIDFSPKAIALCRQRGIHRTAVASVMQLPFSDGLFDAVISCDVLCHRDLTDLTAALREMARVLRPGGRLLLNLPAHPWLLSSHDLAVANVRRFTRTEVLGLLQSAGLTPVRISYWNGLLFPLIAVLRLWRQHFPAPNSDLADLPSPLVNRLLSLLLTLERAITRLSPLPSGLSIFTVARK